MSTRRPRIINIAPYSFLSPSSVTLGLQPSNLSSCSTKDPDGRQLQATNSPACVKTWVQRRCGLEVEATEWFGTVISLSVAYASRWLWHCEYVLYASKNVWICHKYIYIYVCIYIYMIEGPLGSICRLGFCSQYIYNLNNFKKLDNLNPAHLNHLNYLLYKSGQRI